MRHPSPADLFAPVRNALRDDNNRRRNAAWQPRPQAIREAIDTMRRGFEHLPDNELRLFHPDVFRTHDGSYITSLGGYYVLAVTPPENRVYTPSRQLINPATGSRWTYPDLNQAFAQALGFPSARAALDWAHLFPERWRNRYGAEFLQHPRAYAAAYEHGASAALVDTIANHWLAIADDLDAPSKESP